MIFILCLSLYICSLSIHLNYISEKFFINANRFFFIFKYLGCKINSNKLKSNGGFYFTLFLLIIQIFLSIFHFILFKQEKIDSIQSNPPKIKNEKPEIEENENTTENDIDEKNKITKRNRGQKSNDILNIEEISINETQFFKF